ATAEGVAVTMPKVNPQTGFLPDMFAGKYGVFEALIDDPIYGPELKAIKAALEAKNQALADTLWNKSKWGKLDSDAQSRILMKIQNENLYKERFKSWLINIKRQLAGKGLKADDAAEGGSFETAGYDSPFTPGPERRNEILIRLKSNG
ncbi:MAG: hypothetical protein ACK53V_19920, partial [Planctomycetota bacterium]